MEQSQANTHSDAQAEQPATITASVRPSASSLLPTTSEPEPLEQRQGVGRNEAYHEKASVRRVDPQEEAGRQRQIVTLGLEVALALMLTAAARFWSWAQEERARARVDRELRRRAPAT
ncbi:MAG TPA: hypothetical protein VF812_09795 [Ktedonobacterales bacterium]